MIILNWVLFLFLVSFAYAGITYVGQLTAHESASVTETLIRLLKPSILFPMILATMAFNASLYYGFLATPLALSVAVSVGVIISFLYSTLIMSAGVSALKLLGLALIVVGIFLIK